MYNDMKEVKWVIICEEIDKTNTCIRYQLRLEQDIIFAKRTYIYIIRSKNGNILMDRKEIL